MDYYSAIFKGINCHSLHRRIGILPDEKLKINIEGYYKVMHNLAVINDELIYPTDKQLINASGESYGTELP